MAMRAASLFSHVSHLPSKKTLLPTSCLSTSIRRFSAPPIPAPKRFPVSGDYYSFDFSLRPYSRLLRFGLGFRIPVPLDHVYIIERFGKYLKTLHPGFPRLVPFIDKIAYIYSLKERRDRFEGIRCVTLDKFEIRISGLLYYKVVDPVLASYSIACPIYATMEHALHKFQTEVGKVTIEDLFTDRNIFIENLLILLNSTTTGWGVKCVQLEINAISCGSSSSF